MKENAVSACRKGGNNRNDGVHFLHPELALQKPLQILQLLLVVGDRLLGQLSDFAVKPKLLDRLCHRHCNENPTFRTDLPCGKWGNAYRTRQVFSFPCLRVFDNIFRTNGYRSITFGSLQTLME